MAYEENFAPEPEETQPQGSDASADTTTSTTDTTADTADTSTQGAAADDSTADTTADTATDDGTTANGEGDGVADDDDTTAGEADGTASTATDTAFDESAYLKGLMGDAAPATAAEAKAALESLRAKQITPEIEAQLAVLRDPAKLAEFASLATKDFDKLDAVDAMRERFAQQNPDMSEAMRERRFQKHFAEKYPTLAAAIASPDDYAADDPALIADREEADYDAKADRAALKAAQTEQTQKFIASQAAATQPQLTPEQLADATSLPTWLDQTYKDGSTLPVDAGDGLTLNLPITNAADFKAAFGDTYGLLDKLTLTKPLSEGGVINRANLALATAFLQNPQAFVQNIAKQVRANMPEPDASIPVAQLTNSANRQPAAKPAAAKPAPVETGTSNQPAYVSADDWQNSNV